LTPSTTRSRYSLLTTLYPYITYKSDTTKHNASLSKQLSARSNSRASSRLFLVDAVAEVVIAEITVSAFFNSRQAESYCRKAPRRCSETESELDYVCSHNYDRCWLSEITFNRCERVCAETVSLGWRHRISRTPNHTCDPDWRPSFRTIF